MEKYKLTKDNSVILFCDQQERLMPSIFNKETVIKNSVIMAKMAKIFNMPALMTTQYKKGLGDIVPEIGEFNYQSFDKISFSAYLNSGFREELEDIDRPNIIITGAETHICVYQTVRDLINANYNVYVVADSVGSRTEFDYNNGLELMRSLGAIITNTETVLFDIMEYANIPEFKECQSLII